MQLPIANESQWNRFFFFNKLPMGNLFTISIQLNGKRLFKYIWLICDGGMFGIKQTIEFTKIIHI